MSYIGSNILPILAAALAGLLIGAAYLALFTRLRVGSHRPVTLLTVAFVAEFWLACILAGALILAPVQANAWTIAIGTAVVIWIGFVVPVLVASYAVRNLRLSDIIFDCLHWLAVMVSQAAALHLIGLARP